MTDREALYQRVSGYLEGTALADTSVRDFDAFARDLVDACYRPADVPLPAVRQQIIYLDRGGEVLVRLREESQ